MKKRLLVLLFTFNFFISCGKKDYDGMCTMEYVSFGVRFEDAAGEVVEVEEYSSVNKRTGVVLSAGKDSYTVYGGYLVASDGHMKDISKKGDVILVSGKHPVTKTIKQAEFKISSGDCHIQKASGPTIIVFD